MTNDDDATRYLQAKIDDLENRKKYFEHVMTKKSFAEGYEENADQAIDRLRKKHTPPRPKTAQDRAAAYLAYINGPVNSTEEKG